MTDAAEQRIAVLEFEVRALKIALGAQQRTLTPPSPRREEPSVKITHPVRRVAVPSVEEFGRLSEIVLARWPQLHRGESFDSEFKAAFIYLLHTGRRDRFDREHALTWWTDTAIIWLRERQLAPNGLIMGGSIGGSAFVAAAIAHGDIMFTPPDGFSQSFGLQWGGGGILSSDCWRSVLETARLLEPTPLDRPVEVKSPARVVQLALNRR